jgi:cell division protein FtsN
LARNDEGEFELILGNRQLVSVFLIVVILLGVFFSMGYIVGRNSSPPTIVADSHTGSGKPIVVDNTQHPAAPLPEEPTSSPVATPPAAATPPTATPIEQAPPAPVVEKPSPVKGSTPAEKKLEESKRVELKPAPPPEAAKRTAVGEPPPGVYLQVVATTRADAEIVSESLLKKGFRSMVAPVPDQPTLNRVVVGPYKDPADMADGRSRLEAAGFKPYVRKY